MYPRRSRQTQAPMQRQTAAAIEARPLTGLEVKDALHADKAPLQHLSSQKQEVLNLLGSFDCDEA